MRITIELTLQAQVHESNNDTVTLEALRFPGCSQNLLQFLSPAERALAQQMVEEHATDEAIAKVERLLEQRAMAGDRRREQIRDDRYEH